MSGPRSTARSVLLVSDDDSAHLRRRRRPLRRAGPRPAGHRRRAGHPRRPAAPERRRLRGRLAGRRPHRRGDDPAQHVLDQPRAGRAAVAAPTSRSCSARPPTGRTGYDDTLSQAIAGARPGRATAARRRSVPSLRRIAFTAPCRRRPIGPGRSAALVERAGARRRAPCSGAAEAAVTPADRMVIVHTSGSTSAPKGVIHTHGALIRHLDNLNELRRYDARRGAVLELAVLLDRRLRLRAARHAGGRGPAGVLERGRRQPTSSTCSSASGPRWSTGSPQSVAHLPDDPSFAGRDLSSIRRGNLWPIMPADVRPGRSRAAPLDARA